MSYMGNGGSFSNEELSVMLLIGIALFFAVPLYFKIMAYRANAKTKDEDTEHRLSKNIKRKSRKKRR